ncbi:MAG TPA: CHRD domain-containing protein [Longimicrobiales bacterium]
MHIRSAAACRILLVAGLFLSACDDDDDRDRFEATLSGANEVPANSSTATGSFTLTDFGNRFAFRLTVQNLDMPTAAHIHFGGAGVNGGVLVPLFGTSSPQASFSGTLADDEFVAADIVALPGAAAPISLDSLRVLLRTGGAYVNVHTTARPAGEIRGQVVAR